MSPDKKEDKALMTIQNSLDLTDEQRNLVIAEMNKSMNAVMDSVDPVLPVVKLGKEGNWLVGADANPYKKIKVIILEGIKAFAYWHNEDITKNAFLLSDDVVVDNLKMPLCSSMDGITGSRVSCIVNADGRQVPVFGQCNKCYLATFGTARDINGIPGAGMACKHGRRFLVMVAGENLPHLLYLPPTSAKIMDAYRISLKSRGVADWMVWTELSLVMIDRGKGVTYAILDAPKFDSQVDIKAMPELITLKNQFRAAIKREVSYDEYEVVEEAPNVPVEVEGSDDYKMGDGNGLPF